MYYENRMPTQMGKTLIKGLKQNADSISLICEGGKIHIESCAIMTDRFIAAVNSILEKKDSENI